MNKKQDVPETVFTLEEAVDRFELRFFSRPYCGAVERKTGRKVVLEYRDSPTKIFWILQYIDKEKEN